ncbi:UPF0149 family protein [Ferrimonas lipolytica]|uniref:YecA family protein n=1 Tax=Ferrimonas lipolytica TaxID=2724191 RepID=A0A6H1UAJ7_9GAMM|nr:UPF0149 family protein [Ferrimonas lipolytica]QIZ76085.1 YecA family protein [Ferrimonas lipolytica]
MKNKLSKTDEKRLIEVLDDAAKHGGLNFWQSQGFLTHLHCYPKSMDPSGWSCAIAAMEQSKSHWPFDEKDMDLLFVLFNQIHERLHEKQQLLPSDLDESIELIQQRQLTQPLRNWCAGFVFGYRFLREEWPKQLNEQTQAELEDCVGFIGYVATLGSDEDHAVAWRNGDEPSPQQLLATMAESLEQIWSFQKLND